MTQAVPVWASRMTLAFLPTHTSPTNQGLPHGWSGCQCHHAPTCPASGHCHLPRWARLLLTVYVVTYCVLWTDTMVSPHINHNSKIHAFSHTCCLETLGFVIFPYASPVKRIQSLSVPSPTNLNPASFIRVCVPRAQRAEPASAAHAASLPIKWDALCQLHPTLCRILRKKFCANPALLPPRQADGKKYWKHKCQQQSVVR